MQVKMHQYESRELKSEVLNEKISYCSPPTSLEAKNDSEADGPYTSS